MGMKEWAEREVQIACERENPDRKEGEWDYGCACYESALKAFNSLMEDGHSGMSIGFTIQILNRLIAGKPLTPIEDTEDIWKKCALTNRECTTYQCNRMYSLFKEVYPDGTVKYHDNDRIECVDFLNGNTYHNGFISRIIDEMYPITMPYSANGVYNVYCIDFPYDPKNGDYDTIEIKYITTPEKDVVGIYRYFKESDSGFVEIDLEEYIARRRKYNERKEKGNESADY